MTKNHVENRIIWAVDPFEEPLKAQAAIISTLRDLSRRQKAVVEPVHVLNFTMDEAQGFKMAQHQFEKYKQGATQAVLENVKDLRTDTIAFMPPRVLMLEDSAPALMAKTLVRHAGSIHAHLIVVGTHARHGIPRLVLGSFTETLLLHSQVPVVAVGPECAAHTHSTHGDQTTHPEHLLFATDLESNSFKVFQKVLEFAHESHLKITLFHVTSLGIDPVVQSGAYLLGGGWVPTQDELGDQQGAYRARKQKVAEEWIQEAQKHRVDTDVHFDSGQGPISDLILRHARTQKSSWIAMAAESGAVKSALIGSITRQVVRQAACPVWVARA